MFGVQRNRERWSAGAAVPRILTTGEFKHIIDTPFLHILYPPMGYLSAHDRAEAICDYFAGCLLMPRTWVKGA